MTLEPETSSKRPMWLFLGFVSVASILLLGYSVYEERKAAEAAIPEEPEDYTRFTLIITDVAPLLGVSVNGQHRAYPIQILLRPSEFVQNHMLGGQPICVSYNDTDKTAAVFYAPHRTEPFNVLADRDDRRERTMVLRIGKNRYWQDTLQPVDDTTTEPFPYPRLEHVRTTWGEWRRLHPDTERYIGNGKFLTGGQ